MLCPFDGTTLQIVNRSGVDIDWCPMCKGVWLERGELDKLIDLAAGAASLPPPVPPRTPEPRWEDDGQHDRWNDRRDDRARQTKRTSLLSEIFDF